MVAESNDTGAATAAEIVDRGGDALFVPTDVSDKASYLEMADTAENHYEPVSILGLVNNAITVRVGPWARDGGERRSRGLPLRLADLLRGQGWVRTSGACERDDDTTSPSGYLKQFVDRETSNWVMVVLERAGVVDLDRRSHSQPSRTTE